MSHPVEIPRHVDDPPTLLLWRIDDLVPVVLMLVLGILVDQLLVFLLLGIVLVRLYGRFRDSRPDGYGRSPVEIPIGRSRPVAASRVGARTAWCRPGHWWFAGWGPQSRGQPTFAP